MTLLRRTTGGAGKVSPESSKAYDDTGIIIPTHTKPEESKMSALLAKPLSRPLTLWQLVAYRLQKTEQSCKEGGMRAMGVVDAVDAVDCGG
jgi:hypothetical protein